MRMRALLRHGVLEQRCSGRHFGRKSNFLAHCSVREVILFRPNVICDERHTGVLTSPCTSIGLALPCCRAFLEVCERGVLYRLARRTAFTVV